MLKDILYTGLGGALLLKDRVEEGLVKLEERGKLSKDDTKQFLDDLKARGEEENEKYKEQLKEALREVIEELGLATKEDIAKLKADKE
jgi:polyhydroxyalkanoate synthesis regulator phasin